MFSWFSAYFSITTTGLNLDLRLVWEHDRHPALNRPAFVLFPKLQTLLNVSRRQLWLLLVWMVSQLFLRGSIYLTVYLRCMYTAELYPVDLRLGISQLLIGGIFGPNISQQLSAIIEIFSNKISYLGCHDYFCTRCIYMWEVADVCRIYLLFDHFVSQQKRFPPFQNSHVWFHSAPICLFAASTA